MRSFRIGKAIDQFLAERGYDRRRSLESVFGVWEEVVGTPFARMAHPLSLENGVLTVGVPNAAVASEVLFSQSQCIARVNGYLGVPAVRELRTRVTNARKREPSVFAPREEAESETFQPDAVTLTAQELAWIDENAARVPSAAPRESLKRALTMQLKRQKWDAAQAARIDRRR